MTLPPSLAGEIQLTVAWALLALALTPLGAAGTVGEPAPGVTLLEALERGPLPIGGVDPEGVRSPVAEPGQRRGGDVAHRLGLLRGGPDIGHDGVVADPRPRGRRPGDRGRAVAPRGHHVARLPWVGAAAEGPGERLQVGARAAAGVGVGVAGGGAAVGQA